MTKAPELPAVVNSDSDVERIFYFLKWMLEHHPEFLEEAFSYKNISDWCAEMNAAGEPK
jgi:hypothetical protein